MTDRTLRDALISRVEEELMEEVDEAMEIDHQQVSQTWKRALALAVHSSPLQQFGISFGVGWFSGYLFRRVSRTAAFLLGCSFLAVQGASTLGIIKVNWRRVGAAVQSRLNRVQSFSSSDTNSPLTLRLIQFCQKHVYITSGFTTGAVVAITF